jgi:hypothetical protein
MNAWRLAYQRRLRIGDKVTRATQPSVYHGEWDGTVVDILNDLSGPLFRVYWRYPPGKVSDYRPSEVSRVK